MGLWGALRSPRKRAPLFLSVCPTVGAGFQRRPGVGFGWAELAVLLLVVFTLCCLFHPISLVLPKETGWSPKERRLGWWRPRGVSGPTRLSHSRGRCHSAAKVSASRTYFITRPRGEGLGLAEVSPSKSFLPRFFTKKRAGSRGGALGRAPQRAERPLCFTKRRKGLKGEPSPGVPPLRAAPAARSSAASAHRRNAGRERTPGGGGTPPLRGVGGTR